jgi:hypothetical protein
MCGELRDRNVFRIVAYIVGLIGGAALSFWLHSD